MSVQTTDPSLGVGAGFVPQQVDGQLALLPPGVTIPSATVGNSTLPSNTNPNTYRNPTTPAMSRLGLDRSIKGPATGNQRLVYMGEKEANVDVGVPKRGYQRRNRPVPVLVPVGDARYMMETLAPVYRQRLYDTATAYFGHSNWDYSWLDGVWERAINVSANSYAYAGKENAITPVDAFVLVADQMKAAGGGGAGGGGGGGGGGTSVRTQVQLTNPTNARSLVDNALDGYLGRKATQQEADAFYRALNVQEAKSPYVTTTSQSGSVSSSVTEGGFNPSTFAEDWARSQEGSSEYQAATTYLDAFIGALKARV